MKAKKILYLIAGILKIVAGAIGVLFGALTLLVGKLIREVFVSAEGYLQNFAENLAKVDESYSYLVEAETSVQLDFVMKICNIFAVVLLILALIYIALGVFNILFSKRTGNIDREKLKSTLLCVFSWVFSFLSVSTILTTIAVLLKKRQKKSTDDEISIETYQV